MVPYLGANCPACGAYNTAAETTCWSCRRPMAHTGQPAAARRRPPRRFAGLVLAGGLVIATVAYAADALIPGPPADIQLSPDFVKVGPAEATTFAVSVHDARGHTLAPELTWTSDGGIVTTAGLLTVPTRSGSYRVTVATANGLTATANVLVEPGPPSTVEITRPGTVKPSELASLSAIVRDGHGNAIEPARVIWSASPATGSIDANGRFRTRVAGTYTIEARSGEALGTSNVVVVCPPTHNDMFRGVTFSVVCGTTGDIWIAGTMSTADTRTILTTIDRDVTDLEKEFALQLNGRFRMFAYASSRSFSEALAAIFPGASGDVTGVYVAPDSIVVDWQGATSQIPESTVRHELSHLFVERASGRLGGREIPAWFDEGLATIEQYTVSGSGWQSTSDRYCAASAAATGAMPTLGSMTQLRDFQRLEGRLGYVVGAQAVRFLVDEIGMDGIRKMLTSVGVGHHWDDAYREASGKTWESFVAAFPDRVRALAPGYPGVAFAPDAPNGNGVSYIVYGFDPGGSVRVSIDGARFTGGSTHTADEAGCYLGFLGPSWPSGTYAFTASGRAGSASGTLRK